MNEFSSIFIPSIIFVIIIIAAMGIAMLISMNESSKTKKQQTNEQLLNELISSERYINSKYRIHQFGKQYALCLVKDSILDSLYLDLTNYNYVWKTKSPHFEDCLGTIEDVIEAFDFKVSKILEKHYTVIILM